MLELFNELEGFSVYFLYISLFHRYYSIRPRDQSRPNFKLLSKSKYQIRQDQVV